MSEDVWKAWNRKPENREKFFEKPVPLLPPPAEEPSFDPPPPRKPLLPFRLTWRFPFIRRNR